MKLRYLIVIFILFICTPVYAADISTSISGKSNIEAGDEFTVTLNVTGQNVWGLSGILNYDTSRLTLVGSSGLNGFTAMFGTGFSLDTANGKSGTFEILSLTFKATSTFKPGENTTISIVSMTGATDSSRLTVNDAHKNISVNIPKSSNSNLSTLKIDAKTVAGFSPGVTSYNLGTTDNSNIEITAVAEDSKAIVSGAGNKSLNYGNNKFDIVVKAENGTTKTYTININRRDNRSANTNLKSLSISNAKINFNKSTLNYNVIVDNKIETINIKAEVEDSKASISGTGEKKLNVYLNTFNIVVTAENGATKTYRINVSRKDKDGNVGALSTNNKLKALQVKGYELSFDPEILRYNLSVDNVVDNVEINAEVMDNNSTIKINNIDKLVVGENLISIEVVSQSGDKRTYEIVVVRKNDAPIVEIKELINTINKTTSKQIEVEIKDEENKISSKIIKTLKGKDIELKISKYEGDNVKYVWTINGNNIKEEFDFDTLVNFESSNEEKINELTNYAQSIYLNYSHSGKLPKNTKFKVYVGDKYKENDVLNLYYYDEKNSNMILKEEELLVKNGFVEFEIEHCSEYVLTQSNLKVKGNNNNLFVILTIVELLIIVIFIILDILNKNPLSKITKKSKKKKAN